MFLMIALYSSFTYNSNSTNTSTKAHTSTVSVAFPSTSVRLQTIMKNWKKWLRIGKVNNTLTPNSHLTNIIRCISSVLSWTNSSYANSELDSHTNMIVFVKHAFIFESTGYTSSVQPCSPHLGIDLNDYTLVYLRRYHAKICKVLMTLWYFRIM